MNRGADTASLRVEAVVEQVREQLHVPLHLTVTAGGVADVQQPHRASSVTIHALSVCSGLRRGATAFGWPGIR